MIKCNQGGTNVKLESAELLQPTKNSKFKLLDPNGLLKNNEGIVINSSTFYLLFLLLVFF